MENSAKLGMSISSFKKGSRKPTSFFLLSATLFSETFIQRRKEKSFSKSIVDGIII